MQVTYLRESQGRPCAKHFSIDPVTGEALINNYYQQYKEFSSIEVECSSIDDFYSQLTAHADMGNVLIKGNYIRPLVNESRSGLVDKEAPTQWICLDFDGIKNVKDADTLLVPLGMNHVDHIVQYSARHGMSDDFRAHVFIMLDTLRPESVIKQWYHWLNLTVPTLSANISLTAPGTALRWPLDVSLAEAHRLIYIAHPSFDNTSDPFAKGGKCEGLQRITLVRRGTPTFNITAALESAKLSTVGQLKQDMLADLRRKAGLRPKNASLKYSAKHNTYISTNPDHVTVTERRVERGFVYLDFAGGTGSMGYFHPEHNFEIIHNFKGEPRYLTKNLAPEYYAECVANKREQSAGAQNLSTKDNKPKYFYFTEKQSGAYFKGTWIPETETRILDPARQRIQIDDFCMQNGMDTPTFIPVMETIFDPTKKEFFNEKAQTINLYKPSKYKLNALKDAPPAECPPTIKRLVAHALGDDEESWHRFMNWLAYIWQTGKKPKTAWILHGRTGTGKGAIMENILQPMFGYDQAMSITTQPLSENFNGYLRTKQILMIDESDTDGIPNIASVTAKLRNWITELSIVIREMRQTAFQAPNFTAFIFTGNRPNVTLVEHQDRRFNVAPRQEKKLLSVFKVAEFDLLAKELPAFCAWLQAYPVSVYKATHNMKNQALRDIQNTTSSSPADVVRAIKQGDFRYFIDLLPSGIGEQNTSTAEQISAFNYTTVLKYVADNLGVVNNHNSRHKIPLSRDDISVLFGYALDWRMRPGKFSKTVSKFGLHFVPLRIRGKVVRGTEIEWDVSLEDFQVYQGMLVKPKKDAENPIRSTL